MRVINLPRTRTLLALGVLLGAFGMPPMLALLGARIPPEFASEVRALLGLWRDALLMTATYYFTRRDER